MDRTKTIHANESDHGTSFWDVSNCLKKASRGGKTFLAAGLLALLAGWISLMASTGGIDWGHPVASGAAQATVKFAPVNAQELLV